MTGIEDRTEHGPSAAARVALHAEGRPAFRADWNEAMFIHYRIRPEVLQRHVPIELDTLDGWAYVSLVAFTQDRLRPTAGGRLAALASAPLACHEFLNLRTYVKHGADRGIFFLAEWIPNRLALLIGPRLYGLPFRLARHRYRHDHGRGRVGGRVLADGQMAYEATIDPTASGEIDDPLTTFLVERYTAYTHRDGVTRRFRIWHEPWPRMPADVEVRDDDLIHRAAPWFHHAEFIGATFSPGVSDVEIGRPVIVDPTGSAIGAMALTWTTWALASIAILVMRDRMPAWGFMWLLAGSIFLGGKLSTLRGGTLGTNCASRLLGYLFAWPGMNAVAFLDRHRGAARPATTEWIRAAIITIAGAAMLAVAARMSRGPAPVMAGWIGGVGVIFFLHFGTFHLLSLAWRARGVAAEPIMRAPLTATSLNDFWSRRWNVAFHDLARRTIMRPLARRGVVFATLATFGLSGLVHDVVISLPAGGGYGRPTLYFLLQGIGLLLQRSALSKRLSLDRGFAGWAITVLFVAGPAYWLLFHPPFVNNVIVPMLRDLHLLVERSFT